MQPFIPEGIFWKKDLQIGDGKMSYESMDYSSREGEWEGGISVIRSKKR